MNEKQTGLRNAINDCYKELSDWINCFPKILQMKADIFNEELAKLLNYSFDSVERFTSKKMTSSISYNELFAALTQMIINTAYKDNKSAPERAKKLLIEYTKLSSPIFFHMATTYSKIELLETYYELLKKDGYDPDVLMMEMTLGKFMQGLWPENSEGLSKEEADYLRKCLKFNPPICVKPKRIEAKAEVIKGGYQNRLDRNKSNSEIMDEKAMEIFGVFLKNLLQNSELNPSETSNFLKELLIVDETEKEERQP